MKGSGFIYILCLAAALLSSCIDSLEPGHSEPSGTASLTLHISGEPQTRVPLSETEDNIIKTLGVWLTDATGTIIQFKGLSPNAVSTTVEFTRVPRGEHKLYIVANYSDLAGLIQTYNVGGNINTIENVELPEIANATSPEFTAENGVTSTLIQDVVISPGVNEIEAHLIRVVGRLTITFRNGTDNRDLFVGSVGLSKKNPSKGYLFGKSDHSNPSSSTSLDFPDLTSVIKIAKGNEAVVYDTYLYESTPAISGDSFKAGFTTGMYEAPKEFEAGMFVEGGTMTGYKPGSNQYTNTNISTWYMIRAGSLGKSYLYDNNGTLSLHELDDSEIPTNDDIKKYCWTFSSTSGSAIIKNVATGRELTLTSSGSNNYSVGLATNGNGDDISISTSTWRQYIRFYRYLNRQDRYIRYNGSTLDVGTNGDERNWALRPVTTETKTTESHFVGALASTTNSETYDLKYIDMYGVAQNLEHICRNEHVNLTVNVYHHVATGGFVFEVEKWSNVSNETTFD